MAYALTAQRKYCSETFFFMLQITSLRCCTVNTSVSETSPPGPAASRPWRTTCPCIMTTCSLPTTRVNSSPYRKQKSYQTRHLPLYVWCNYGQWRLTHPNTHLHIVTQVMKTLSKSISATFISRLCVWVCIASTLCCCWPDNKAVLGKREHLMAVRSLESMWL